MAFLLEGVCTAAAYVIPNPFVALAALGLGNLLESMSVGPIAATVQTLVAPRMRATAQTLITVLPNFVGLGLGPLVVGALSDALNLHFGQEALRWALLLLCPGYVWAAWHLWCAGRAAPHDLIHHAVQRDGVAAPDGRLQVAPAALAEDCPRERRAASRSPRRKNLRFVWKSPRRTSRRCFIGCREISTRCTPIPTARAPTWRRRCRR